MHLMQGYHDKKVSMCNLMKYHGLKISYKGLSTSLALDYA